MYNVVYYVKTSGGSYDDYWWRILDDKYFLTKEEASEAARIYNLENVDKEYIRAKAPARFDEYIDITYNRRDVAQEEREKEYNIFCSEISEADLKLMDEIDDKLQDIEFENVYKAEVKELKLG